MILTAKVKLLATEEQRSALLATLRTANDCRNWISKRAFENRVFRHVPLHHLTYHAARQQFPELNSSIVDTAVREVASCYKGGGSVCRVFRPMAAFPMRPLTVKRFGEFIRASLVGGRISIRIGQAHSELPNSFRECDLQFSGGEFYLAIPFEKAESDKLNAVDCIGVDLGVSNIAADSDGHLYSGNVVKAVRIRHRRLRGKLQKKKTRSAKRRLRKLSGKESRFSKDVNHCISKQIVNIAQHTNRSIALEDLKGIRARIRARRDQRAVLHSWAFYQLRTFIAYKAALAGVPVYFVDPAYSSRTCPRCGNRDKKNRPTQSKFCCTACGHSGIADLIAASNLRERGRAATNRPYVSDCAASSHDLVTSL